MDCFMNNKENDVFFILLTGFIRMHVSAYANTGILIDDEEVGR